MQKTSSVFLWEKIWPTNGDSIAFPKVLSHSLSSLFECIHHKAYTFLIWSFAICVLSSVCSVLKCRCHLTLRKTWSFIYTAENSCKWTWTIVRGKYFSSFFFFFILFYKMLKVKEKVGVHFIVLANIYSSSKTCNKCTCVVTLCILTHMT